MVQRMLIRDLLFISAILIAVSAVAVWGGWHLATRVRPYAWDIVKLVVQFFLITVVGGLAIWTLNYLNEQRREYEKRSKDNIDSMHIILSTISELYRAIKRTKRILRSRSNWYKTKEDTVVCPQGDFVDIMDELQDIQIRMEMLRDDVSARHYVFPPGMADVIDKELHYVTRYLHDVFEEYERGHVQFSDDKALIGSECHNLQDFIYQRKMPQQFADAVEEFTDAERGGHLSVAERCNHLLQISEIRDELGRQRYAGVASALERFPIR
jgi:hypothetical protein